MAHGSNVSCLSVGPSSGRVMVTGGEDRKVNMWAVGKPNVILVRFAGYIAIYHEFQLPLILSKLFLSNNLIIDCSVIKNGIRSAP